MFYAQDPTQIAEVLQALENHIQAQTENKAWNWYALVDSAFDYQQEDSSLENNQSIYSLGYKCYFSGRVYSLIEAGPVLLPLPKPSIATGGLDKKQLLELLQHCSEKPMLSFIFSAMDAHDLIESWRLLHMVKTKDMGELLLRFADTRSQAIFPQILQAEQWAAWTINIDHWLMINRNGKLQPVVLAPTEAVKTQAPLHLSDAQLDKFLEGTEADAMLEWASAVMTDVIPRTLSPSRLYEAVHQTLDLARKYQINDQQDKLSLLLAAFFSMGRSNYSTELHNHLQEKSWMPGELGSFLSTKKHLF